MDNIQDVGAQQSAESGPFSAGEGIVRPL